MACFHNYVFALFDREYGGSKEPVGQVAGESVVGRWIYSRFSEIFVLCSTYLIKGRFEKENKTNYVEVKGLRECGLVGLIAGQRVSSVIFVKNSEPDGSALSWKRNRSFREKEVDKIVWKKIIF